jgi:hypothetical protein
MNLPVAAGHLLALRWLLQILPSDAAWGRCSSMLKFERQSETGEHIVVLKDRIANDAGGPDREQLDSVEGVGLTDSPVRRKPRLPVGADGLEPPVRSGCLEDPLHEHPVVVPTDEPLQHRRHFHEDILGQQLHERLNVGLDERRM